MEFTIAQKNAMAKMSRTEWKSSYTLQVSRNTLDALVRKGAVLVLRERGAGFMPANAIKYKLPACAEDAIIPDKK